MIKDVFVQIKIGAADFTWSPWYSEITGNQNNLKNEKTNSLCPHLHLFCNQRNSSNYTSSIWQCWWTVTHWNVCKLRIKSDESTDIENTQLFDSGESSVHQKNDKAVIVVLDWRVCVWSNVITAIICVILWFINPHCSTCPEICPVTHYWSWSGEWSPCF